MSLSKPFYKNFTSATTVGAAASVLLFEYSVSFSGSDRGVNEYAIQNNGAAVVTVYGRLNGSSSFAVIDTIPAGTIRVMPSIKGLVALRFVASSTCTGVITG